MDHGFNNGSTADLRKRLTLLIRKTQPYIKRIAHKAIWVEPPSYWPKSNTGRNRPQVKVRRPFFKGLREGL